MLHFLFFIYSLLFESRVHLILYFIFYYFCRQFSIFFIIYCVLVFAIAIQNINESYGEVKAYRGRIAVALLQPKSALFTSSHETITGLSGDADTNDDIRTNISENEYESTNTNSNINSNSNTHQNLNKNMKNSMDSGIQKRGGDLSMRSLFCIPTLINSPSQAQTPPRPDELSENMDCNEFVIEALLKCNAIDYDKDLEPILNVSHLSTS